MTYIQTCKLANQVEQDTTEFDRNPKHFSSIYDAGYQEQQDRASRINAGNARLRKYHEQCAPKALSAQEYKKLLEEKKQASMYTKKANAATASLCFLGTAGLCSLFRDNSLADSNNFWSVVTAGGITALYNYWSMSNKAEKASNDTKNWVNPKVGTYLKEGASRQDRFADAVLGGDIKKAQELMEHDVDINHPISITSTARNAAGDVVKKEVRELTPLMTTSFKNNKDMRRLLLDHPDIDLYTVIESTGDSILTYAAQIGDQDTIEDVLKKDSEIIWELNFKKRQTPTSIAIEYKHYHLIEILEVKTGLGKYILNQLLKEALDKNDQEEINRLQALPFFENNYKEEVAKLLRANPLQLAIQKFTENNRHLDPVKARKMFLNIKTKLLK